MRTASKTISISSRFPASAERIWAKLQEIRTLQYIAKPYATFKSINKNQVFTWCENAAFEFHLKVFGFIPMGVHIINVIQFDKETLTIYTNESNKYVRVWNHKIVLNKIDADTTGYTDEVEIYAGWRTPFIVLWSRLFYRHRQRKWLKLLK